MLTIIISFLTGGAFIGTISYFISRIIHRAKAVEMCDHELCAKVNKLKCEVRKLEGENKVAIKYGCDALDERNEALIMLSKKLSNDTRNN